MGHRAKSKFSTTSTARGRAASPSSPRAATGSGQEKDVLIDFVGNNQIIFYGGELIYTGSTLFNDANGLTCNGGQFDQLAITTTRPSSSQPATTPTTTTLPSHPSRPPRQCCSWPPRSPSGIGAAVEFAAAEFARTGYMR